MKLTNEDRSLLLEWGHLHEDFDQIERAFGKTKTTYEQFVEGDKNSEKKITREEALELLGREVYLSGISRSAFHWSAVRTNEQGQSVYFDSSKLFQ